MKWPLKNPRDSRLWPKVLDVLDVMDDALSAQDIAYVLDLKPDSVYASMSGMGRAGNRHWIAPVGTWDRRSRFRITEAGREEIADYRSRAKSISVSFRFRGRVIISRIDSKSFPKYDPEALATILVGKACERLRCGPRDLSLVSYTVK